MHSCGCACVTGAMLEALLNSPGPADLPLVAESKADVGQERLGRSITRELAFTGPRLISIRDYPKGRI